MASPRSVMANDCSIICVDVSRKDLRTLLMSVFKPDVEPMAAFNRTRRIGAGLHNNYWKIHDKK